MKNKEFGQALKKQRLQLGLTQKEVAEKTGISLKSYADYENGNRIPQTKATYFLLANSLESNVDELIKFDERFAKTAALSITATAMPLFGNLIAPVVTGMLLSKQINKNLKFEHKDEQISKKISNAQKHFKTLSTGLIFSKLSEKGYTFSSCESSEYDLKLLFEDSHINNWCFDFWSSHFEDGANDKIPIELKARMMLSKYMFLPKESKRKISLVVDNAELFNTLIEYKNKSSYYGNLSIVIIDFENITIKNEETIAYYSDDLINMIPDFS